MLLLHTCQVSRFRREFHVLAMKSRSHADYVISHAIITYFTWCQCKQYGIVW